MYSPLVSGDEGPGKASQGCGCQRLEVSAESVEGLEEICTGEEGEKSQGSASQVATEREEVRGYNLLSGLVWSDSEDRGLVAMPLFRFVP